MKNILKIKTNPPFGAIALKGAREFLAPALVNAKKTVIVSDDTVCMQYCQQLKKLIDREDLKIYTFVYPGTENGNSKYILDKLLILMTEVDLEKTDCIVALGGTSAMALTGFAASIFKGGIPYINIPTTLSSMCGGCIGGAVGANFLGRENLLSSVYYPKAVFCDTDYAKTLSEEQLLYGLAIMVRAALSSNAKLFELMEQGDFALEDGVFNALKLTAKANAGSKGGAVALTLGETIAKAARYVSHYTVNRGDSLAFGILLAAEIAEKLRLAENLTGRLKEVFNTLGVVWEISVKKERVIDYILNDKKVIKNGITLTLPVRVGKCVKRHFTIEQLSEVWFGR